jgi:hypothetical protein
MTEERILGKLSHPGCQRPARRGATPPVVCRAKAERNKYYLEIFGVFRYLS